MTYETLAWCDK